MSSTPVTPDDSSASTPADRRRRRRALLAGGLVLGLGAAVTLAAWSDNVVAGGLFNSGTFELQGATDGTTFQDYDAEAAGDKQANLAFSMNATSMSPGQTVYAPLTIATSTGTTLNGTFTLSKVAANGDYAGVLSYRIASGAATHGANCSADGFGNLTTWAGDPTAKVNGGVAGPNGPLAVGAKQATPQQHLCIAVTMGNPNASQSDNQKAVEGVTRSGNDTSVTWTFTGTSTDA